jgi:riboflavin kinase/FMN adenylyltransferase
VSLVFHGSSTYASPSPRPVATIGNFDGVHLGHQALLASVRARAEALRRPSAVLTFDPSPVEVLRPERAPSRIQAAEDRVAALRQHVDHVIVERFDHALAAREPEWFAREILGNRLNVSALVVGFDFRFGRGRAGSADDLRAILGVPVDVFAAVDAGGEAVSSSRIRTAVLDGEVALAGRLLGRPHRIGGIVVHGDARGRTIGFPTANLVVDRGLLPAHGVYAVRVAGPALVDALGVMNIGVRPTFAGRELRVEVHVLDFAGDLYDARLDVDLVARIRGEQAFAGIEALVAQIHRDVETARRLLA